MTVEDHAGWEIVCPDGRVRCYPYHNKGDAKCDARARTKKRCDLWPKPSPIRLEQPPCPEGTHTVRAIKFSCVDSTDAN